MVKELFPVDVLEYLKEEFHGLFEYYSNGEEIGEFLLLTHQAMIILESKAETNQVLTNILELEFVEEIKLNITTLLRIGVYQSEDVQIYYSIYPYTMIL